MISIVGLNAEDSSYLLFLVVFVAICFAGLAIAAYRNKRREVRPFFRYDGGGKRLYFLKESILGLTDGQISKLSPPEQEFVKLVQSTGLIPVSAKLSEKIDDQKELCAMLVEIYKLNKDRFNDPSYDISLSSLF